MAHHQLFEWQSRPFAGEGAIPESEAERLARAASGPAGRLGGGRRTFDLDRTSIRARSLVGIVVAPGASCEILPKVDRDPGGDVPALRRQLVRMLEVAHDLPVTSDAAAALDTGATTLLEVLIARFVALLGDAVRRGMPRAYVPHEDDLPALRGRLDVRRQFTALAASPQRLACRYDEFSADTALNQVMKSAVARLARLARGVANQRALAELTLVYADVSDVPRTALRWDVIVPDRTNARWQALLRLVRLILGDRFQNTTGGASDGFALLFDMNLLFERYVAKLVAGLAPAFGWRAAAQGGARACLHPEDGGTGLFATFPDIRLLAGETTSSVIDTKWKRLTPPAADRTMGVAQADVYQMMAYAQLYRCDRLLLLYPHHGGFAEPVSVHHRVAERGGDVRLMIATLDLSSHAQARASLSRLLSHDALADHDRSGREGMRVGS